MRILTAITFSFFLSINISEELTAKSNMAQTPYYDIKLDVSPEEKHLTARGMIKMTFRDFPQDSIKLLLNKTMGDLKMEIIEPHEFKQQLNLNRDDPENGQTTYTFKKPVGVPENSEVRISFSYQGGRESGFQFYLDSSGTFAAGVGTAWYPQFLILMPDDSYSISYAVGKVEIKVPGRYTAIVAGGVLKSQTGNSEKDFLYEVTKPGFLTFYIGKYYVTKYEGSIPVEAYTLGKKDNMESYVEGSAKVIENLVKYFGQYPYEKFMIFEMPDDEANRQGIGGASVPGGIMMPGSALEAPFNLALYGHEISHQWWGNHVTRKGEKGSGMLDEAIAQYGALLVIEELDMDNGAEKFRRKGYPGYIFSQSGFGYLKNAQAGIDNELSSLAPNQSHLLGDSKGFLVYSHLGNEIGRQNFFTALKNVTSNYSRITWEEFLSEIEKAAGQDLGWFYEQWFDRTGAPEWSYEWKQNGNQIELFVTQEAPYYRIDNLEVQITGSNGETASTVIKIDGEKTDILIPVNFTAESITLDPHFKILHWDPAYKQEILQLAPVAKITSERVSKNLGRAEELYDSLKNHIPEPDIYGVGFRLQYEIARIRQAQGRYDEAIDHFKKSVQSEYTDADLLPWVYYRMAQTAKEMNNMEILKMAVEETVRTDELNGGRTNVSSLAEKLLQNTKR